MDFSSCELPPGCGKAKEVHRTMPARISPWRSLPFFLVHLASLSIFWCGWSRVALWLCAILYLVRMFGITAGYHRYFSHRSYSTSRWFQFTLAWVGASAMQKGPLWWAANHRHHHTHSDDDADIHSPVQNGFWWSHVGWILTTKYDATNFRLISDLAKYPELRWLNRYWLVPPVALAQGLLVLGWVLQRHFPHWGTSPVQMLAWGFFVNTVLVYHGTFSVNSLTHVFGSRRFPTTDNSRNSFWIAVLTLGEGWHNNHHYVPSSERQGFYFWEVDIAHYMLVSLSSLGLVWDLQKPPRHVLNKTAWLPEGIGGRL